MTTKDTLTIKLNHIILARGFAKLSMTKLAELSQISRASLYLYFNNRTAIVDAVLQRHLAFLQQNVPPTTSSIATLPKVILNSFLLFGSTTQAFLTDLRNNLPDQYRALTAAYDEYFERLTAYYQSAQDQGLVSDRQTVSYLLFQNRLNIQGMLAEAANQTIRLKTGAEYLTAYFNFFVEGALTPSAYQAINWDELTEFKDRILQEYYDTYMLIT